MLALVGIVLLALSLRTAVASLSPLYGLIARDFALPAVVIGLITTAPPVCYGLFGIITPRLENRFGLERLAVAALAAVAAGLGMRALVMDAVGMLAATTLVFAGIGVGNILMPPLVKKYFPDRLGMMTALYSTTLAVSTFVPPLVAVPVAEAAGWRWSLGLWAVFSVLALIPWVTLLVRARGDGGVEVETSAPGVLGRLVRLPLAWALTVSFAVSSTIAYTAFGWLPTILVDIAGVMPATAGTLLSLFGFVGLPCSLVAPVLITRFRATGVLYGVAVVLGIAGVVGFLVAPAVAPWLWTVLFGMAPLLFPMILVLLSVRSRSHHTAVALSSFVQSIGYAIAAVFPLAVGLLHDATGGWEVPLWVLGAVIVCAVPAGIIVTRSRTVEDAWEARHGPW